MDFFRNNIFLEDLEHIHSNFSERSDLKDSKILITGCAGFLGFYFLNYFSIYSKKLGIKKIIGLDNFIINRPGWLEKLQKKKNFR